MRRAASGGCDGARGLALLGHAALDVLAVERRRVDVAHDDQDAGEARARVGLATVAHHALDRLQRTPMAQAQRVGMPCAGVARAEFAQQRRELPAKRERHGDDDEPQRAGGAGGRLRTECARRGEVGAVGEQQLVERVSDSVVGTRDEHLRGRPADEPVGGRSEQSDDAGAALGDRAVGRAEDIAAVGEAEQDLLDVLTVAVRRGRLIALKAHVVPIGRRRRTG